MWGFRMSLLARLERGITHQIQNKQIPSKSAKQTRHGLFGGFFHNLGRPIWQAPRFPADFFLVVSNKSSNFWSCCSSFWIICFCLRSCQKAVRVYPVTHHRGPTVMTSICCPNVQFLHWFKSTKFGSSDHYPLTQEKQKLRPAETPSLAMTRSPSRQVLEVAVAIWIKSFATSLGRFSASLNMVFLLKVK